MNLKARYSLLLAVLIVSVMTILFLPMLSNSILDSKNSAASISDSSGAEISTDPLSSEMIHITGPITLSRNDLFDLTNKKEYLNVIQTDGEYFEDWTPGPFMGRTWRGNFQIQLSNEQGEVKSSVNLNSFFDGDVVFNSFFNLEFDDYNGDGNLDFTIGQYASSNGNVFKLFTLSNSGDIKELQVKDHNGIFISDKMRYSTKLSKTSADGFSVEFYDNSIGNIVQKTFAWKETEFVSTTPK